MSTTAGPLFGFVQVEYPWALGPADGRYVLRGHAGVPTHVLMLATLGAAERRGPPGRRRRKPRAAPPEPEPGPVVTARATLVAAEPFGSHAEAERWREEVDGEAEADDALRVLKSRPARPPAGGDRPLRPRARARRGPRRPRRRGRVRRWPTGAGRRPSSSRHMAIDGGLDAGTAGEVARVLGLLEAALRARTSVALEQQITG